MTNTQNTNSNQAKWQAVLEHMRHVTPIGPDGKFDPDILQVGLNYLNLQDPYSEYSRFLTGHKEKFSTSGLDPDEKEAATLLYDQEKRAFIDKEGNLVTTSSSKIYNVTKDGKLIIQPSGPEWDGKPFNHSSIGRDESITCNFSF